MLEKPDFTRNTLLDLLETLNVVVMTEPRQPMVLIAEDMVMHWHRVLDGQDVVQPRLDPSGYLPTAFHFGMESDPENWLDPCGIGGEDEDFASGLKARQQALLEALQGYFGHAGYRSSSESCDQLMLHTARFSRFLQTWALEGELRHRQRWKGRRAIQDEPADIYARTQRLDLQMRARRAAFTWEPYCNTLIVAWAENQLNPFEDAAQALAGALTGALGDAQDDAAVALPPPGFPLRPLGQPRRKLSGSQPEQRPMRTRTLFPVRWQQLKERLIDGPLPEGQVLDGLAQDVSHAIRMCEENHFLLSSDPGFFEQSRAGVPVVRGRAVNHPFLLDPQAFFKKAVLFHNGTYSRRGGALDQMYLQLRQLERVGKFEHWAGITRDLRPGLESCLLAWDENRWNAFTEGLLEMAMFLRGGPGQSAESRGEG